MLDAKLREKFVRQQEMLANRVKKKFRKFKKSFARRNISVFRLYDWDIPEIRAVVDWYDGHLVIGEYVRKQSVPEWLPMMGEAAAGALDIPMENVHLKERRAGKQGGKRYERIDHTDEKIIVRERDFRFAVNPRDFVDTGLFSDHRDTRRMVREMATGKEFLNLFCYTGTFSCYAAAGGAKSTVSVDRSETAIRWAKENMELNGFSAAVNRLVHADTFDFLKTAAHRGNTFDLCVVDPPSFSNTRTRDEASFDIQQDHPRLLAAVLAVMRPGAIMFFSTNHQDFTLQADALNVSAITEITNKTIPVDYVRNRTPIHRCWEIRV